VLKQNNISDIASSAVQSEADLRAVLAIPVHFQQNSRQTVMRSAEEAGFEVLQVISEPSAAVLAYGVGLSNLYEEQYVPCICRICLWYKYDIHPESKVRLAIKKNKQIKNKTKKKCAIVTIPEALMIDRLYLLFSCIVSV